jgi:lambda repressor-like predicted transcriptional regulator
MDIGDLLKNPAKATMILNEAIIKKNKELAEALIPIVKHPYLTYRYAKEIARGKVKDEWEEIIIQDPYASFDYAYNVLKGPFPKGEEVIAQNPHSALNYSLYVLKGPFPKGENAIAKEVLQALSYAREILKDRFKKGEETIIKDKYYLNEYVKFLESIGKLDEFLKDHPEVKISFS